MEEVDVDVFVGEDQLSRCSFKGRDRHVVWPNHDQAWWGTGVRWKRGEKLASALVGESDWGKPTLMAFSHMSL